ncbi:hypothetical protein Cni_G21677 [Canna indica]|uniref:O-fucosyltransferase family protein n=1 Tax=Canna indica TaxID=4628 RepID=A0AAQ3KTJ8_9LILI|nr:hypothetical protein Cni_G21677 [Canna indica]
MRGLGCRAGGRGNGACAPGGKTSGGPPSLGRLMYLVAATVFRRRGVFLVVPLTYLAMMLLFLRRWNPEAGPLRAGAVWVPPGSVYRTPLLFEKLWPSIQADVNRSDALWTAWHQEATQRWKPCPQERLHKDDLPPSNGFLIIEANGGLNQQRLSICDAVAVAGLLNATLVIPKFHLNSVWHDSSKFEDIFDEDYFIEKLKHNVRVVKELPEDIYQRFDNNISNILNMRTKALSSKTYYLHRVLPKLLKMGAIRIAPFSKRLARTVPSSIQRLRCLANYEALQFAPKIKALAERMIDRMVNNSSKSDGKYVAVHLRFEKDMIAFSNCVYDGGKKEKLEMDEARERGWRGKFSKPGRVIIPEARRRDGRCPLTPLEVGMMLRGMGFDTTTLLYVASGEIYSAEKYMAPLHQLFPHLETKYTLSSVDELAPFKGRSSQLAALDYSICAQSDIFVTTQGTNFPHFLMGHRRYLYGHSKTIRPDKRKLVVLFDNPNIRWDRFKHHMHEMFHQSDQKGIELRKPDASIYTFPMPDCMCLEAANTSF